MMHPFALGLMSERFIRPILDAEARIKEELRQRNFAMEQAKTKSRLTVDDLKPQLTQGETQ